MRFVPSVLKSPRSYALTTCLLMISAAGDVSFAATTAKPLAAQSQRVSVMTYNVENLFDTKHDECKNDYTFLPLELKRKSREIQKICRAQDSEFRRKECLETDWSERVFKEKIKRVAATILQVQNGRGPDIQILVEMENQNALDRLNKEALGAAGYTTSVLLEGPDERGIDTAVLSRFPQWDKPQLHLIPFKGENAKDQESGDTSRGILEVRLLLPDGQKVAVFAAHFPSQSNPSYLRKQAAEYLLELQKNLPRNVLAIAGGDLNITSTEEKDKQYYAGILAPEWLVSHFEGCKNCQGTHYYHTNVEWSFLDSLLFSKTMKADAGATAGWKLDAISIQVPHASPYQVSRFDNPASFKPDSHVGVSDHWPVYAEIYKAE